jgi:hypothetical protein
MNITNSESSINYLPHYVNFNQWPKQNIVWLNVLMFDKCIKHLFQIILFALLCQWVKESPTYWTVLEWSVLQLTFHWLLTEKSHCIWNQKNKTSLYYLNTMHSWGELAVLCTFDHIFRVAEVPPLNHSWLSKSSGIHPHQKALSGFEHRRLSPNMKGSCKHNGTKILCSSI